MYNYFRSIEYIQKCIAICEETLRAMGLFPPQTTSRYVENSQLSYKEKEYDRYEENETNQT